MILTRIGFDRKIHPYQLQLWLYSFLDILGIQSGDSVILDLRKGVISFCHTDRYEAVTTIREYVASDDGLIELYDFSHSTPLRALRMCWKVRSIRMRQVTMTVCHCNIWFSVKTVGHPGECGAASIPTIPLRWQSDGWQELRRSISDAGCRCRRFIRDSAVRLDYKKSKGYCFLKTIRKQMEIAA